MPLTRWPGVGSGGCVIASASTILAESCPMPDVRHLRAWRHKPEFRLVADDAHRHNARPLIRHKEHSRETRELHLSRQDLDVELDALARPDRNAPDRSP